MTVSLSQRIYIFTLSCCLLFALLVASILWSWNSVELAYSREQYSHNIENETNNLKQLIISDNIYAANYNADNWLQAQQKLINLLNSAPKLTAPQQIIQNSINSKTQSVKLLFNKINENKLAYANEAVKKYLKVRLITQLEMIRSDAFQLSLIVQKNIHQVIKQQGVFIVGILLISIYILLYGAFRLTTLFSTSLKEIKTAFKKNHSGHFQTITLTNYTEDFDSIVKAFNEMNQKLSKSMVSLDEMKKIVAEKTRDLALLSNTDHLTGVANRRALFERGNFELARTQREHNQLTVLLMDCDYFKKVNDSFGHQAGDLALQHVCKICNKEIRDIDFLGRYGGEEFVIILPHCDLKGGVELAARIQNALAEQPLQINNSALHITLSIGIATLCNEQQNFENLIDNADQAMYMAKENGRNRIEVSDV
jgi:diguanylate cyclase (GGDEF)-like protein